MVRQVLTLTWLAVLSGCSAPANICPDGQEPAPGGRCVDVVPRETASTLDGSAEGATPMDAATDARDASADARQPVDAHDDSRLELDAGEGSVPDAQPDAPDSTVEPPPDPHCAADDVAAWDAFHSSASLNDELVGCAASCPDLPCLVECSMEAAGVAACSDCIQVEATCLFETCWMACGHWESSPACRACLCEADCTGQFEGCAERSLGTCADAFTREPAPGQETPTAPLLLGYKESDGTYQAHAFDGLFLAESSLQTTYGTRWSTGWNNLVPFEHDGQTYLLQHRSECAAAPCTLRISPMFADGSPGTPLIDEEWSPGWDEMEILKHEDALYLLALKTGAQVAANPGPATARIARLDWSDGMLALTPMLEERWPAAPGYAWSSVETLAIDEQAYVLRYATEPYGDVEVLRIALADGGLHLERVGATIQWDQGIDLVHTFRTEEGWFVLRYKGGSLGGEGDPAGTVHVAPLTVGEAGPAIGPDVHTDDWGPGITHVAHFVSGGATFLLTSKPITPSRIQLTRLGPSSTWAEGLGSLILDEPWSGTRPRTAVAIAKSGKWSEP